MINAEHRPEHRPEHRTEHLKDTASSSTLRDKKQSGEKFLKEAPPRVREAMDQVSNVASDLYNRTANWLDEGNNRNFAFVALAATAGLIGFFLGRNLRSPDSEF